MRLQKILDNVYFASLTVAILLTCLTFYAADASRRAESYGGGYVGISLGGSFHNQSNAYYLLTIYDPFTNSTFQLKTDSNLTGLVYAFSEVRGVDIPFISSKGVVNKLATVRGVQDITVILTSTVLDPPPTEPAVSWLPCLAAWLIAASALTLDILLYLKARRQAQPQPQGKKRGKKK